jgi:CHAT domain-containing protein
MLFSTVVTLWLAVVPFSAQTRTQADVKSLPTGEVVASKIGGETKHLYEIALSSGEFFQVRVAQHDVEVLLRLLDAGGKEMARMTLPRSYRSEETLTFVAPATGTYQLEISPLDARAALGEYTVRREDARTATSQDQRRVAVERVFAEGMIARVTAGQAETAIEKFTEARAGWQELADAAMADITALLLVQSKARATFIEGRNLLEQGSVASTEQALIKFEAAGKLYREGGEIDNEGASLVGAALAASNLKKPRLVIEFLKQAAPLFAKLEQRDTKVDLLLQIVKSSISIRDDNTALEHLLLALPIYQELGLQREAAVTAMTIGAYYSKFGDNNRAYEYLSGVLPSRSILGDKCTEVELLANFGATTLALDRKAEAIKFLDEELSPALKNAGGCEDEKAAAFNNLGRAYFNLNDLHLAIDNYNQALTIVRDPNVKADTYLNLGAAYYAAGRYKEAIPFYRRASSLYKVASEHVKDKWLALEFSQGGSQLEQLKTSLNFTRELGDKGGEAKTLSRLGEVYLKIGNKPAALTAVNQALKLYATLSDRSGEVIALGNAMKVWSALGDRRTAIFFGKHSLNKIQELRGAARGIEISLQQNYLRTFKSYYQQLAELLIQEGLFEQAAQVLNLYRDQQFFDLDPNSDVEQVYLSTREDNFTRRYETESRKLRDLTEQVAELNRQLANHQDDAAGAGNLVGLQAQRKAASESFATVLNDAANAMRPPVAYEDKDRSIEDVTKLRKALGKLGENPREKAASLYTLTGDDNFYVLLLTPDRVEAFTRPVKAGVVDAKSEEFLAVLSCPDFDPFQSAAALYNIIFKSVSTTNNRTPLEEALEKYHPNLLLWSLDDPLDSVPMSALYDAGRKQFLVERYQHTVFTRARPERIAREPKPWIKGIGLGTSKEYTGYSPLPGVRESLSVIFDDEMKRRKGIIDGPALIDGQFKRSVLENLNGEWPLVYIASHFDPRPGDSAKSVLLLGDGDKFSLAQMQKRKTLFAGVELLTLSACKTSLQGSNAYGKEIDGFAELTQRLGAISVIAALWNVNDLAASGREIDFYQLYRDHQDWAKAELLRQSQLNLLRGHVTSVPGASSSANGEAQEEEGCSKPVKPNRLPRRRFTPDPKAPLAHPYYWAPFVLYGSPR